MKKKPTKNQRSLFSAEFLPVFIFVSALLVALTGGTLYGLSRSVLSQNRALMITLYVLLLVLMAGGIYALARVFFGDLWALDNRLQSGELYRLKPYSYEKEAFAPTLLDILDEHASASRRESTYQLLQKQAEFDALQNQINPHFLYNTLDAIRGKALEDGSQQTAEMLETLAVLFRYSISTSTDMVSLEEELQNIENYFKIQQYRFGERYRLEVQVGPEPGKSDPRLLQSKIPKLSLQPILENAFYHGLDEIYENGLISVRVVGTQARVEISISDNGKGMSSKELQRLNQRFLSPNYQRQAVAGRREKNQGIALQNINARIKFSFGDQYGLVAYSTPGVGTEVVLTLPSVVNDDD